LFTSKTTQTGQLIAVEIRVIDFQFFCKMIDPVLLW
jgi:hypothetical protein